MILRNVFIISLFLATYIPQVDVYGAKKKFMVPKVAPKIEEAHEKREISSLPFSFIPPKKWQCIADKEGLPAKVEAVYIGNGSNGFNPSINIAMEKTDLASSDYLKMAKHYHDQQPQTKCHILGPYECKAGRLELLQIDQTTSWGEVRFLQATYVQEHMAYVITATCLEKDYNEYYPKFLQSLQTFSINTLSKIEEEKNHD